MKIIGLAGAKNSGKSTFAEMLRELTDGYVIAYADPIKYSLKDLFGFTNIQLWGSSRHRDMVDPDLGFSTRKALETFGDAGRKLCPNIWVKTLWDHLEHEAKEETVIITDVRFDNEAEEIRKRGGIIINLTRNKLTWWQRLWAHNSAKGISKELIDYNISNQDMPLEELRKYAAAISKTSVA